MICILHVQLSRKRILDDEFQEAVPNASNFWWTWLHGQERSKAQESAAAAAIARAQATKLSTHNVFAALAEHDAGQVRSRLQGHIVSVVHYVVVYFEICATPSLHCID